MEPYGRGGLKCRENCGIVTGKRVRHARKTEVSPMDAAEAAFERACTELEAMFGGGVEPLSEAPTCVGSRAWSPAGLPPVSECMLEDMDVESMSQEI